MRSLNLHLWRATVSESHGEANFPNTTVVPQSCIYFGFTPGFFFNLLWIDRLLLKLKLLYIPGLLFLRWFFKKLNSLCTFHWWTKQGQLPFWQVPILHLPGLLLRNVTDTSCSYLGKRLTEHPIFHRLDDLLDEAPGKLSCVQLQASCVLSVKSLKLHLKWIVQWESKYLLLHRGEEA